MPRVTIDAFYCKGCGQCVEACPKKILRLSETISAKGYPYAECIDPDSCITCRFCYTACPDVAITIEK